MVLVDGDPLGQLALCGIEGGEHGQGLPLAGGLGRLAAGQGEEQRCHHDLRLWRYARDEPRPNALSSGPDMHGIDE
jgi:hypothetical protein